MSVRGLTLEADADSGGGSVIVGVKAFLTALPGADLEGDVSNWWAALVGVVVADADAVVVAAGSRTG